VINSRKEADKRSNINKAPPKPVWASQTGTENMAAGTSIFDPVLCELIYKWFCKPNGLILDCFAGGSVRGIVASKLGYKYIGVDLSEQQIIENRKQAKTITPDNLPVYHIGDSKEIDIICKDIKADLLFTCPPYWNLEIYSDNPNDISNMNYPEFKNIYKTIINKSCDLLDDNSFACFVVGEVRDKQGNYINFIGETIQAFLDAGLHYYNEAVLVTACGSLPIRITKQFNSGRKLGKTHQNILIFLKGNSKLAVEKLGECEFGEMQIGTNEEY
jgi:DNA modification methylase